MLTQDVSEGGPSQEGRGEKGASMQAQEGDPLRTSNVNPRTSHAKSPGPEMTVSIV